MAAALEASVNPVTTEAVITEASHLLGRTTGGAIRLQSMLIAFRDLEVIEITPRLRKRVLDLMVQYADAPMDYADATLVAIAEDFGIARIFTLDRRDFLMYRLYGRESFRIIP
ncbi:MAG: PIN domain-containing protein [Armatimonadia bacterium]